MTTEIILHGHQILVVTRTAPNLPEIAIRPVACRVGEFSTAQDLERLRRQWREWGEVLDMAEAMLAAAIKDYAERLAIQPEPTP
jgi:hypothetical protein